VVSTSRRGQTNIERRYRGTALEPFAGSQPDHAFPETGGYRRSQKDTKAHPIEFRRTPEGPVGHEPTPFGTVRAPGSNSGPPTQNLKFKIVLGLPRATHSDRRVTAG
jgi:hypothetical protein